MRVRVTGNKVSENPLRYETDLLRANNSISPVFRQGHTIALKECSLDRLLTFEVESGRIA